MTRRTAIAVAGAAGAAYVVARGSLGGASTPAAAQAVDCTLTGQRTEGPYFVDEMLNRSDIRPDPTDGSVSGGVPLALTFALVDIDDGCAPIAGAQVDLWHCDANGDYSDTAANNSGPTSVGSTLGQKFLRGFQVTGDDGRCTFLTIFPGWYNGRTVHMHFKVRTAADASYDFNSQLFFDEATTQAVLATDGYKPDSGQRIRNTGDGIYGGDGSALIVTLTGDPSGYAGTFTVGLRGLAGSGAAEDEPTAADVGDPEIRRTRGGRRILTLAVQTDEPLSLSARLMRDGRTLARRRTRDVAAGRRTIRIVIPRRVKAGRARLRVTLVDAAGNRRRVGRSLRVPRKRRA